MVPINFKLPISAVWKVFFTILCQVLFYNFDQKTLFETTSKIFPEESESESEEEANVSPVVPIQTDPEKQNEENDQEQEEQEEQGLFTKLFYFICYLIN